MTQAQDIFMDSVRLEFINKKTGQAKTLLENFNFTLKAGHWTCVLGKSGCGKTSLLRLLAGLLETGDTVNLSGFIGQNQTNKVNQQLNNLIMPDVAYMAQQDLLLPWLDVLSNACLLSKFEPLNAEQKQQLQYKAIDLLTQVGLADVLHAMPSSLSGGMRQRVALVRTLLQDKPLVLMDEPFSALDAVTRHQLQNLSAKLLQGKTVFFITHDPQEALRLADELYLMSGFPAQMTPLALPTSNPPRVLDADLVQQQQQILSILEANHD